MNCQVFLLSLLQLGNTDNEDVTVATSVKSQKSGSYEFTNDNKVSVMIRKTAPPLPLTQSIYQLIAIAHIYLQ